MALFLYESERVFDRRLCGETLGELGDAILRRVVPGCERGFVVMFAESVFSMGLTQPLPRCG